MEALLWLGLSLILAAGALLAIERVHYTRTHSVAQEHEMFGTTIKITTMNGDKVSWYFSGRPSTGLDMLGGGRRQDPASGQSEGTGGAG